MARSADMPDFVVIGAMKCSTSTLHDQLALQSGISMSDPKEPNFFSDGPNFARGMDWYRGLFSCMPIDDLKGESSTHLTKYPVHPESAERLHEALPDAKLVYVMRDPIDRLVSHYIHEWSESTISSEINTAIHEHPRLLDYSSYAMQLGKYTKLYERSSILPVFFERLMRDPQLEFERICRHIGYEGTAHWNTEREASNVSSDKSRWPPAMRAVLNNRSVQIVRRSLVPRSVRTKMKSRWQMKERPVLTQDSIEWLHEQLDPDMNRLGAMIGRTLSCANFRESVLEDQSPDWDAQGAES